MIVFFFFQAEDGIRDVAVTGVQTCALPIYGRARNRFYAFDKRTGELVWYSTPGIEPIDSTFATPVYANLGNQRVIYQGTGCGHVVCINARTGEPVWRYRDRKSVV